MEDMLTKSLHSDSIGERYSASTPYKKEAPTADCERNFGSLKANEDWPGEEKIGRKKIVEKRRKMIGLIEVF